MEFPHGICECALGNVEEGGCCGGKGPAAYLVIRNGERMKVCTKCDLSSDQESTLLVTEKTVLGPYMTFDELGACVLAIKLIEKRNETKPTVH